MMSDRDIQHTAASPVSEPATKLLPLGALMLVGMSTLAPHALAQTATTETLPTVTVQGDADKPDGLRATATRVGKTLQDPHDIPQAVTTITNTLMEQQQTGSLREALRNVSGLSFNAAEGGRAGDNMNLRGFYTFGDMYLDGIRDTAQYNRETFNLEQIDVLRGAGAMLFGRGQAGGVINQVSKTPMRTEQYKLTGSIGTEDYREVTADLNKPINPNTALRVNLMKRDEGSWRSNPATGAEPEIDRTGAAVSLGLNLYTHNQFWVNYYKLKTNDNPDYGNRFDPDTRKVNDRFPSSYFWGIDRNFDKSDTDIATIVNEYRFSPTSQLRTQLRHADYDRSYWGKTPDLDDAPDALGTTGGHQTRAASYKTLTLQSDYTNKFNAFGMKHEALVGIEYLKEDSSRNRLQNFGDDAIRSYRPYIEDPVLENNRAFNKFNSDSYAVYLQDTVEFIPKWKATAGIRRDWLDADYTRFNGDSSLKYNENSYRTALSYHPSADTHYYVAWSDSFSPTADLYQLTDDAKPAERSDVVEIGAKWLAMNGDLALRAAIYQATKEWERNTDFESTANILTKKRRSRGVELEAAGRITDRWDIFAGLSLINAKILDVAENLPPTGNADPEFKGKHARNTPRYTFNLWSTYQVAPNWKVGGGVEAKDKREAFVPSSATAPTLNGEYHPNTAPSYTRWDAMIAYEQPSWGLRLNVKNLFDKLYYDSVYENGGFAVPGVGRQVILTAEYKF
ncbi:TonB-dependent siderophore receptor [Oxalobacteraceae bacterium R-40]|uniref:TonB-dependent siderophore receptor n=1 Tax=Keguizhuia sedimenti TaxID=3064264 RepID=A0ABU1BIT7_9BURK|nr:TonB-dependent siderophore receptor [Oxalobacteraceae bacterium R-40]